MGKRLLSTDQYIEIGERYERGESVQSIAKDFPVSDSGIYYVLAALGIPTRPKGAKAPQETQESPKTSQKQALRQAPKREWFTLDECTALTGIDALTLEAWADEGRIAKDGKLFYLPFVVAELKRERFDYEAAIVAFNECLKLLINLKHGVQPFAMTDVDFLIAEIKRILEVR